MKTFIRAFAAGAGAVIGASTAVGLVSYLAGKVAETKIRLTVEEITNHLRERTEQILRQAECPDPWHSMDADTSPKACPTCEDVI